MREAALFLVRLQSVRMATDSGPGGRPRTAAVFMGPGLRLGEKKNRYAVLRPLCSALYTPTLPHHHHHHHHLYALSSTPGAPLAMQRSAILAGPLGERERDREGERERRRCFQTL